jgi:RNA polymerase sigma-70 factor (ECF subfamily)
MSADLEFQRIVDLHYEALYRFAYSLTRTESDARDLTQQTYYIWADKRRQIQDESKVKSWLFTTLHREFLRKFNRLAKFPETDIHNLQEELPVSAPLPRDSADASSVLAALARIDPAFQSAVSLFYLEDYTYAEIAEILGAPLGTVKSRIARGVAQLQKLLLPVAEARKGAA